VIRGTTRLAAVIGWPVTHSRSPEMLNAAFVAAGLDVVLVPLGVAPEDLAAAVGGLRAARALGASVTLPHKLAALALCDELAPAARVIGAVNCLQFVGDRLIGHNTDADGFADALDHVPANVVILGAGGAARAVAYGVRAATGIAIVARRPETIDWATAKTTVHAWTESQLRTVFARADLVVDTTPTGLDPAGEPAFVDALPLSELPRHATIATLIYHRRTILLDRAAAAGHATVDGRAMLVHQGARAFALWTGVAAPVEIMRRALDDALRSHAPAT
jgi:shikimate dehydrogenase